MNRITRANERPTHDGTDVDNYPPGLIEAMQSISDGTRQLAKAAYTFETVRTRGGRYQPILPNVSTAQPLTRITTSPCQYLGYSVYETSGNPVTALLVDGDGDTESETLTFGAIVLTANAGDRMYFGDKGIAVAHGLTIVYLSGTGTLAGAVYLGQS